MRRSRNLSRNLHRLLARMNKLLPVTVSEPELSLKIHWPKLVAKKVPYPVVTLKAWLECLLANTPKTLLGGCDDVEDYATYSKTFHKFWMLYKALDPTHPVYQTFEEHEWGSVLPYCVHGDEGRGRNHVPTLVVSYQVVVPAAGLETTNLRGLLDCMQLRV